MQKILKKVPFFIFILLLSHFIFVTQLFTNDHCLKKSIKTNDSHHFCVKHQKEVLTINFIALSKKCKCKTIFKTDTGAGILSLSKNYPSIDLFQEYTAFSFNHFSASAIQITHPASFNPYIFRPKARSPPFSNLS